MSLFKPAPEPASELGRYRFLSPTCGLRVSPFALGAMSLGTAWNEGMGSMTKEGSIKLLDRFYELGGNFIDTANNYQNEESEIIIGEWMKERGNRDAVVLATKYTTGFNSYKGDTRVAANAQGNHIKSMRVSVDASLKKLQTDYIDILFLHWWDWTTSIEEVMRGLNQLVQSGKVLYLGVSDTPAWIVAAANEYARAHGLAPFVVYQGMYSVLNRDLEADVLPMCRHYGMGCITWNSILGGKLQTKAQLEERKKAGEGLRNFFGSEQTPEQKKASEVLEKVGDQIGTKNIQAIALAYVMQAHPNVLPIVGGRKISHLEANIEALSITLTDEQVAYIQKELPFNLQFPLSFVGQDPHAGGQPNFLMQNVAHHTYTPASRAVKPSDYLPKKN